MLDNNEIISISTCTTRRSSSTRSSIISTSNNVFVLRLFTTREQSLLFVLKLPADFVQTKQNVSFKYDNPQGIFFPPPPVAMFVGDALSF